VIRTPRDPGYLRDLFSRSAATYDPVNDLISLGQVRLWRKELVRQVRIRPTDRVLDAMCGPGSLSLLALPGLSPSGSLTLADLSPAMLAEARRRLEPRLVAQTASGRGPQVRFVATDVTKTGLGAGFDVVLVGFGMRYVPDVQLAFGRLRALLKPGGRLGVLEFTAPDLQGFRRAVWTVPHAYFFRVLPVLAGLLAGEREIYDYLSSSTRGFLTRSDLSAALAAAGFRHQLVRARVGDMVTIALATS
jgi:ubiquinone/menaquinone biosynthesis methyltransferase